MGWSAGASRSYHSDSIRFGTVGGKPDPFVVVKNSLLRHRYRRRPQESQNQFRCELGRQSCIGGTINNLDTDVGSAVTGR